MNPTADQFVSLCENDAECGDGEKCCYKVSNDAQSCVRRCVAAEAGRDYTARARVHKTCQNQN